MMQIILVQSVCSLVTGTSGGFLLNILNVFFEAKDKIKSYPVFW